jgi:hypothetical protein
MFNFCKKNEKSKKDFEVTEYTVYNIIIIVFIIIGFLYKSVDNYIPKNYLVLVAFCTYKMLMNYKKCTFSYMECKLRRVKREDGLLASFLDYVVDLRDTKYRNILYILSFFFLTNLPFNEMNFFNR